MKKFIIIPTITLLVIALFSSCKKDDSTSSPSSTNSIQQGQWKIISYIDSGNNETSDYAGFAFVFASGGVVTATKQGSSVNGSWSSGTDDSQLKLYLTFTATPFSELNDDWHIVQQTSSLIQLEDVSGGNGGTDYLTFEKL
jgi:hypothetical protein